MTATELKERWDPELTRAVNSALGVNASRKGGFDPSPALPEAVGVFEGRVDLRGLVVSVILKGLQITGWDFSHCTLKQFGQFSAYNHLVDCRFLGAKLGTNLRDRFERCDFSKANLTGATLGSAFIGCTFDKARLSKVLGDQVAFDSCSFRGTKLSEVQLTRCRFIRCDFGDARFSGGSIAGSTFDDCGELPDLDDVLA